MYIISANNYVAFTFEWQTSDYDVMLSASTAICQHQLGCVSCRGSSERAPLSVFYHVEFETRTSYAHYFSFLADTELSFLFVKLKKKAVLDVSSGREPIVSTFSQIAVNIRFIRDELDARVSYLY